jgi:hypothetical protein
MTHRVSRLLFCGLAVLAASVASAAGTLPKDGTWARYYVVLKSDSGNERVLRTTVRFVGTVVEKGKKHRWVEIGDDVEEEAGGGKKVTKNYAIKFLISEKDLRTASNPIQHFVRAMHGEAGKPPEPIVASQRFREVYDAFNGQSLLFLSGPSRSAKTTKHKRTIDYQDGRLSITSGRAGTNVTHFHFLANSKAIISWKRTYELWTHKAVPLGMASLKYRVVQTRTDEKGKVRVIRTETGEYTIEAWGTDAKTAIPNAK